jgi:hypothetical protein
MFLFVLIEIVEFGGREKKKEIQNKWIFDFGFNSETVLLLVLVHVEASGFGAFRPNLVAVSVEFDQFENVVEANYCAIAQEAFVGRMHCRSVAFEAQSSVVVNHQEIDTIVEANLKII